MSAPHDDEDGTVLRVGLFLGADPDYDESDQIFEAWMRTHDRYRRDPAGAAWWRELGDRTVEFHALVDLQPVPKRRFWSRSSPTPVISVTVPLAGLDLTADLDTYFSNLQHIIWQRIATKSQWPPPPDRQP
ncbi:hypothetical protein [Kribbella solani]|uniref:hypothetical protein n=1 Tax=Kribbella solani TaxID=236067 RepID=UPI0029AA61F2|nr:hypothetical protein [Kribbella solani]MDX2972504.1 hypothetical protein [Kribbella solani]